MTAIISTESESYSVSQCALDCVYLRRVMDLMGYPQEEPTPIAQDNNTCIFLVKGSGMYAHAKYIDTRVHRVREFDDLRLINSAMCDARARILICMHYIMPVH